ncbi:hypothetical protein MuYL_1301 [Mucilaginibacter xinganensis]|uniref:Uncharacterized protein n=1 Tax=Mucilaginibacter xinganensis TaxID=1234841 RepID=A0A223NTH3_9SPHI|nr:hypothetical protein MuYL_1301 [Mucilaginibacter xinganensis]
MSAISRRSSLALYSIAHHTYFPDFFTIFAPFKATPFIIMLKDVKLNLF